MYLKIPFYCYCGWNRYKRGKAGQFGPNSDMLVPIKTPNSPVLILEGPESPKSPHKLVLPEDASTSVFYTAILGEMDHKWQNWSI